MDVDARGMRSRGDSSVATHRGRRCRARAAIASALVLVTALAGCSDDTRSTDAGSPSASPTETEGADGDDSGDGGAVQEIAFDDLVNDPTSFVGQSVRVTGNVFFISECPPPGSANADCVLFGYLADPGRRTLIAADVGETIALAEGGRRLSCVEGSRPTPTCGDWASESTYTIEGVVEQQVLGGRETSLVQLDVSEKSAPQHW